MLSLSSLFVGSAAWFWSLWWEVFSRRPVGIPMATREVTANGVAVATRGHH